MGTKRRQACYGKGEIEGQGEEREREKKREVGKLLGT